MQTVVFLAVKPQFLEEVLDEIKDNVKEGQIFISIAPGKTLQWLGAHLGEGTKIIRTMPNTPAMVGEGMTALCVNEQVTEQETLLAVTLCNTFGKTEVIPEHLMDAVVGVSGSSPAYVFMFLEAMADAAVADGMPRAQAYKFAAQAVLGSAKLMLETGKHPGELKDMVCSPQEQRFSSTCSGRKGTAQCSDRGTDGVREESKRNVIFLRKQK